MGGGWRLLGVQVLGLIALAAWGFAMTWFGLKLIGKVVPVRSTEEEEDLGLDISYHGVMAAHQSHEFLDGEEHMIAYQQKSSDSNR